MECMLQMERDLFQRNVAITKLFAGDAVEIAAKLEADGSGKSSHRTKEADGKNEAIYEKRRTI